MTHGLLPLIARRLLSSIPTLLIVSFSVFMLVALVPGDPAVTLAGGAAATQESIERVREQLHLNDPLLVQYWDWLKGVLHLDFGTSIASGAPISHDIATRLPVTLGLVLAAAVIAIVIGVPLGLIAGVRPGGLADSLCRIVASLGLAIPGFWLAVMLVSVFAVNLQWVPPTGYRPITESPIGWLERIILPALALGFHVSASIARQLRGAMIDVLGSNYVRTAWAKGVKPRTVVMKHALRNAAMPALTVFGIEIGHLLGGAVIIETIFALPGLGRYMFDAVIGKDLPALQGVVLVFVVGQILISLFVDISYGFLNPKVRVG
jgi:peptide/nickel transport system permease protein